MILLRILMLSFLACIAALGAASPAWAMSCQAPDYAGVAVSLKDPRPNITSVNSLQQINTKAKSHGLHRKGKMVLGLTQSDVSVAMNYRTHVQMQGAGVCINIMRVDAVFGHDTLEVILPREYARGTCQYNEVLKHEMEHVRVNREGVRKYAQMLKHDLDRAVKRLNPIHARSQQQGKAVVERELNKVVKQITAQFNREVDRQHALIDKPGGPYDATGACRSW